MEPVLLAQHVQVCIQQSIDYHYVIQYTIHLLAECDECLEGQKCSAVLSEDYETVICENPTAG